MTAFKASNGAINYWDNYTGGSTVATLDTYTISNGSTLTIRTDSNACLNHSVAFGSLDTVTFTGTGGTLKFDPTYVRVVAYTAGSGNSPAFGATISQGGVSGVFLGAWTNWQSECIVPGAAIGATGFIKIGGVTGGNFAAGALTGITATCSGPDVQGWIEIRGADTDPLVFTFSKNKVPLDITGNSYTLSVATTPDPLDAVYTMQLTGVLPDPLAGVVTFTPTELEADFIGDYYYDIQMVNGLVKKTVVTGKFKMTQDITK